MTSLVEIYRRFPTVVGAVERGGRVKAKVVHKSDMTTDDMEALTREFVDCRTSSITTDEYSGYNTLNNGSPAKARKPIRRKSNSLSAMACS